MDKRFFVFTKHCDALDTLYFRGVGSNTSRHVRTWYGQKEMIGRTDWYLVGWLFWGLTAL